jgi:hypothetical protein
LRLGCGGESNALIEDGNIRKDVGRSVILMSIRPDRPYGRVGQKGQPKGSGANREHEHAHP